MEGGIGHAAVCLLEQRDGIDVLLELQVMLAGFDFLVDELAANLLLLLLLDVGAQVKQRAFVGILGQRLLYVVAGS